MLSHLIYLIEIIICFLLQSTVFNSISIGGIVPDLLIIIVIAIGYQRGQNFGLSYGILAGLILDISFGKIFGVYALCYMFLGYFAGAFKRFYVKYDTLLPLAMICVLEFIFGFYDYITSLLLIGKFDFLYYLRRIISPRVFYTVIVGIILYKLVDYIYIMILLPKIEEEK